MGDWYYSLRDMALEETTTYIMFNDFAVGEPLNMTTNSYKY